MAGAIRVGTSGFSFPDWVGTAYPPGVRRGEYFDRYVRWFDAVEINSTYYRIPPPATFERLAERAPEGFTFVVKLPREMTHEREGFAEARNPFLESIRPLREAGRLGGLLAQFPSSFRPTNEARAHLEALAEALPRDVPLCAEFRHESWAREETWNHLRRIGVGFVNVDLPDLPGLPTPSEVVTSPVAYVRLHGRNRATWWEHPTPSDRYDYLYSESELEGWATRIERMAAGADVCFAFSNNCHLGQSVVNALQLVQRLGVPAPAVGDGGELFQTSLDERIRTLRDAVLRAKGASSASTTPKGSTKPQP
jgi:uncharacterized protein YecE (DUF72 family)